MSIHAVAEKDAGTSVLANWDWKSAHRVDAHRNVGDDLLQDMVEWL